MEIGWYTIMEIAWYTIEEIGWYTMMEIRHPAPLDQHPIAP